MKSEDKRFYIITGLVLGAAYYFGGKAQASIGRGIDNTLVALNPTDRNNLANRSVNAVGDIIDDGQDNNSFSLGSWLYDFTNQGANDYHEPLTQFNRERFE